MYLLEVMMVDLATYNPGSYLLVAVNALLPVLLSDFFVLVVYWRLSTNCLNVAEV